MNIQINCTENVDEDELRYIYYNLQDYILEYKENKDNYSYKKYLKGKWTYYRKLKGNLSISVDIDMTCNGKTMYFKIKK